MSFFGYTCVSDISRTNIKFGGITNDTTTLDLYKT